MKKVLAIILLLTLLFQGMAHYSVIVLYELRKDYIARNLCENRGNPAMNCCGKCYLKKQLKKVEDSHNDDAKNTSVKVEKQEIMAYILPLQDFWTRAYRDHPDKNYNPGEQNMNGYDPLLNVFRPPQKI